MKRWSCPCAQRIKHYAIKTYEGVDIQIHISPTLALAGGEWSASLPGRFILGTHWIGGCVDPSVCLHDVEKRIFLTLVGLLTPTPPSSSQSLYRLRYSGSDTVAMETINNKKFWRAPFTPSSFHWILSNLLRHEPHRKHHVQQVLYRCVCVRCRGNVFT
jgi:hypothetical protein